MSAQLFLAVQEHDLSYRIGMAVPILLVVAGLLKCLSIARRSTTSAKCVYALALMLLAWLVGMVGGLIGEMVGESVALRLISMALSFASVVAGVVFAILGLVEYGRRPGQYRQGKAQAIWALVLAGLFFLMIPAVVLVTVLNRARQPAPFKAAQEVQRGAGPRTFTELNFRFDAPGRPWVEMDAKRLNSASALAFARREPLTYFMIIAERSGIEVGIDTPALAEASKLNLQGGTADVHVQQELPKTYRDMQGLAFYSEARHANLELTYVHWVYSHNGFLYQLVAWGPRQQRPVVRAAAEEMSRRFDLVDRNLVAHASGVEPAEDFESKKFGYRVALKDTRWMPWKDLAADLPEGEMGALRLPHAAFVVIPVHLLGHEPQLEALVQSFLSRFEIDYPAEPVFDREPVEQGALAGVRFGYERELTGTRLVYQFRVLQGGGYAYLLGAWVDKTGPQANAVLGEILDRVSFFQPAAAPDPAQFDEAERMRHALILNDVGIYYYTARQYTASAPYFEQAFALKPANAVFLSNLVDAYTEGDRYAEALEVLDTHLARFGDDLELKAKRAWVLSEVDRQSEAIDAYAALFQAGFRQEDHFRVYVRMLEDAGQVPRALEEIERYLRGGDSVSIAVLQARLLGQNGETQRAVDLLQQRRAAGVFHPEVAYALADVLREAKRHQEALAVVDDLVARGFDSGDTYYLKASIEYDLKWYKKAKASLEIACAKDPADRDNKSFLEHVSAVLGQGDNTSIKNPIAAVALPVELAQAAADAAPPAADDDENYSALYEQIATAVHFEPGTEYRQTDYLTIDVRDDSGVANFSTLQWSFDPISEEIFVNRLEVFDPQGHRVAAGDVADYYVIDEAEEGVGSQQKTLQVPVPGLARGHRIEAAVTRRHVAPPGQFPFLRHMLARGLPVRRAVLFIEGDISSLKWHELNTVPAEHLAGGIAWRHETPLVYRYEPVQAPPHTFLPIVCVGDAAATWKQVAEAYLQSVAERLPVPESIEALAEEQVAGVEDPDQRVLALARYVQRDYTYQAIEFGRRARVMNPTPQVVKNKYGDCKDHALLFCQLLEAVGVPAQLALVKSTGAIERDLPSLDQFDHMIAYLPQWRGGTFIDCTDKDTDVALPVPYALGGAVALVLDPAAPRLVDLPAYPEGSSRIVSDRDVAVEPAGGTAVRETVTLHGYHAAWMRSFLKGVEPAARAETLQNFLASAPVVAHMQEATVENLDRTELPLVVHVRYQLDGRFHAVDGRLIGSLPALWEVAFVSADYVHERRTPFQIRYPLQIESTVRLQPPPGYAPPPLESFASQQAGQFAKLESKAVAAEKGAVVVHVTLSFPAGRYPPERYAQYHEELTQAQRLLGPNLVFRPADAPQ